MDFKITYEYDAELDEEEAVDRGYRNDVIVEIGDKKYKIYVTSLIRFQQDYELARQYYGFYSAEPNTLFVNDVTKEEIEKIVQKMYEEKYFEKLDNFGFFPDLEKFLK